MKRLGLALCLFVSPGLAAELQVGTGTTSNTSSVTAVFTTPMLAFGVNGSEIFRLDSGGCLRGPLTIRNEFGTEMFRLAAGSEYPTGCMEKTK